MAHTHTPPRAWRLTLLASSLLAGLAGISACGGGDSTLVSGVGSGGTGAFSSGAIRGLGSIVVNGVRYDDSAASISDDSGQRGDSTSLKLGVVVDVQGDAVVTPATGLPTSNASTVTFRSEVKGPVSAVSAAAGTLTVLGQSVVVSTSTVFDTNLPNGLASVAAGAVVEVYGFVDANGTYQATRIEREDSVASYKLRGAISALDTSAKTFRIGTAVVDYAGIAAGALANGQIVRVELATTPNAQGRWVATRLNSASALPDSAGSAAQVELQGVITSLPGSRSFVVNGITVDAASVASLPANLTVGSRIEIKGRLDNGVLTATRVEREDSRSSAFEIKGNIALLDTTAKTFEIRGVLINYANAQFKDGTTGNLSAGVRVEVKGGLNATGTVLTATELEFKGLDDPGKPVGGVSPIYEVKGTLSALNTTNRTFVVRGITVNYATARFDDGTVADLANGAAVEVEGRVSAGVLAATKVDFDNSSSGGSSGGSAASVEIEGSITAVDTTARTITVGGVVVAYGSARFKDGTAANLRVGAKVEVKGTGPVGGVVTATSIEFDD